MIVMRSHQDKLCPILLCDACDQPIQNAGMAAVVFPAAKDSGTGSVPFFVHKGTCHKWAEKVLKMQNIYAGWDELRTVLKDLQHNVNVGEKESKL